MRLPLADQVPLRSHNLLALPMSIIMVDDHYEHWLYNEFLQCYAFDEPGLNFGVRHYSSMDDGIFEPLECVRFPLSDFYLSQSIVDFFRMMLKESYYIYTFCDHYYIASLTTGIHWYHDVLVYGYDDQKGVFYLRTYVNGRLKNMLATYEEIMAAHSGRDDPQSRFHNLYLYRRKDIDFPQNPAKLSWYLLDYRNGIATRDRERGCEPFIHGCVWGMRVYDKLLQCCRHRNNDAMLYQLNAIYCFYENKAHRLKSIRHFEKNKIARLSARVQTELQQVCDIAMWVVALSQKIGMKIHASLPFEQDMAHLIQQLHRMRELEEGALDHFFFDNPALF